MGCRGARAGESGGRGLGEGNGSGPTVGQLPQGAWHPGWPPIWHHLRHHVCPPLRLQVAKARLLVEERVAMAQKAILAKEQALQQRPGEKGWRASKRAIDLQKNRAA